MARSGTRTTSQHIPRVGREPAAEPTKAGVDDDEYGSLGDGHVCPSGQFRADWLARLAAGCWLLVRLALAWLPAGCPPACLPARLPACPPACSLQRDAWRERQGRGVEAALARRHHEWTVLRSACLGPCGLRRLP